MRYCWIALITLAALAANAQQSTVGVGGSESSISNVINVAGQPQDYNLWQLPNVTSNLMAGSKPFVWLRINDIGLPGDLFTYKLAGRLGVAGSMGNGFEELDTINSGSVVTDTAIWPFSQGVWTGTAGQIYTWCRGNVPNTQANLTDTNWYGNNACVFFSKYTNGGTFLVQTSYNGGAFATLATIDGSGFGTNNIATNFAIPLGWYSLRVQGSSGSSKVLFGGVWNSLTNGILRVGLSINGGTSLDTFPVGTYSNLFKFVNPSLITIQDKDGNRNPPYWSTIIPAWRSYCPGADIVVLNNITASLDGTSEGYNAQLRTNMPLFALSVFDMYNRVGTNTTKLVATGLLNGDGIHPLTPLLNSLDGAFYEAVIDPIFNAMDFGGYRATVQKGPGVVVGVDDDQTKTNKTGFGTSTPKARWEFVDAGSGTGERLMFKSTGQNTANLYLQSSALYDPNTTNYFAQAQNGFMVLNFYNGQQFIVTENSLINAASVRWLNFSGGGQEFGTYPGHDPGNGNVFFGNGVQVGGYRSVSGAANAADTDFVIDCNTTSAGFTVTLQAAPKLGQILNIKKTSTDANTLTIAGNGKNIDSAASVSTAGTTRPCYRLFYNGTQWEVLSSSGAL